MLLGRFYMIFTQLSGVNQRICMCPHIYTQF
nr:MAG TPA: hypothetical protein [Caudoviricetes sp.]